MAAKKYRPYLTLAELREIRQHLPEHLPLRRYFDKYIADIEHGFRKENHTLKPSLEERLGFEDEEVNTTQPTEQLTEDELIAIEEAKIFCKS